MASPVVAGALGFTGKKEVKGTLNLLCLDGGCEGEDTPSTDPPEEPVEEEPICKEKRLKRCYRSRCHRYYVYKRRKAWRACRKNCQGVWCTRYLSEEEDAQYE